MTIETTRTPYEGVIALGKAEVHRVTLSLEPNMTACKSKNNKHLIN